MSEQSQNVPAPPASDIPPVAPESAAPAPIASAPVTVTPAPTPVSATSAPIASAPVTVTPAPTPAPVAPVAAPAAVEPDYRALYENIRRENEILRQNAETARRSPVQGVSGGGVVNVPNDDFIRGFDSDTW